MDGGFQDGSYSLARACPEIRTLPSRDIIHQTLKVSPATAAGVTDKLWEIGDIVSMVEAWEAEYSTAGIPYEVGKNKIGDGFFVRVIPRYEPVPDPVYGFKTREEAEAWIAADRKSHQPGRRAKALAT